MMERGVKVGKLIELLSGYNPNATVTFKDKRGPYSQDIYIGEWYLIEHGEEFKIVLPSPINSLEVCIPITEFDY